MTRTLIALFGAPTAWVMQMSLSEPIAAYACYPHQVPLSAPLWVELSLILGTVSLACLTAGLFSGYVAWTFWRYTGGSSGGGAGGTATATTGTSGSQECRGRRRTESFVGDDGIDVEFFIRHRNYLYMLCRFFW